MVGKVELGTLIVYNDNDNVSIWKREGTVLQFVTLVLRSECTLAILSSTISIVVGSKTGYSLDFKVIDYQIYFVYNPKRRPW